MAKKIKKLENETQKIIINDGYKGPILDVIQEERKKRIKKAKKIEKIKTQEINGIECVVVDITEDVKKDENKHNPQKVLNKIIKNVKNKSKK